MNTTLSGGSLAQKETRDLPTTTPSVAHTLNAVPVLAEPTTASVEGENPTTRSRSGEAKGESPERESTDTKLKRSVEQVASEPRGGVQSTLSGDVPSRPCGELLIAAEDGFKRPRNSWPKMPEKPVPVQSNLSGPAKEPHQHPSGEGKTTDSRVPVVGKHDKVTATPPAQSIFPVPVLASAASRIKSRLRTNEPMENGCSRESNTDQYRTVSSDIDSRDRENFPAPALAKVDHRARESASPVDSELATVRDSRSGETISSAGPPARCQSPWLAQDTSGKAANASVCAGVAAETPAPFEKDGKSGHAQSKPFWLPYWAHTAWFNAHWWKYLLADPMSWRAFWCRVRGHPYGVVWYSHGIMPDMHCNNCGDDLG